MDINEIVLNQSNSLYSYVDQLRSHFNILENNTIRVDKIYYDNDIYTVIYEIRPSQYLYVHISQSLGELKQNLINLFDNGNINIINIDLNIDNEKIIIPVKFGLKQISILPYEQIMYILIDLPYKDIKSYCSTSTDANQVCESNYFWKKKLRKEYPDLNIDGGNMEGYYEIQQFVNKYGGTNYDIKRIVNLKVLKLPNTKIKELTNTKIKEIPNSISNLINLTYLALSINKIQELPIELGSLINLTYLDLSTNKIKEIPNSIYFLVNLEELYLDNNEIEEIKDSIGNLVKLTDLYLSYNKIKIIPYSMNNLVNLNELLLSHNEIEKIPELINNFNI